MYYCSPRHPLYHTSPAPFIKFAKAAYSYFSYAVCCWPRTTRYVYRYTNAEGLESLEHCCYTVQPWPRFPCALASVFFFTPTLLEVADELPPPLLLLNPLFSSCLQGRFTECPSRFKSPPVTQQTDHGGAGHTPVPELYPRTRRPFRRVGGRWLCPGSAARTTSWPERASQRGAAHHSRRWRRGCIPERTAA